MVTLILSIVLTAQSTMVSESGFSSLNNNTHHLIDPTLELSVNDVLKDYTSNQTRRASSLSLGFDDAAHWFIASAENSTTTTKWILEFEYPLLDFIDIYTVRSDGSVEQTRIGDRFPFSERYFPSRFLHLPLDVAQNETVTLLWRIQTKTSLIAGARIAPESIWKSRTQESVQAFLSMASFRSPACSSYWGFGPATEAPLLSVLLQEVFYSVMPHSMVSVLSSSMRFQR